MLSRRTALGLLAAVPALGLLPRKASASVARAVSLEFLVRLSDRVALVTPLGGTSRWETVGNRRRIVTHTRVRIDQTLAGVDGDVELMVRTLGGRVGKVGQIVHGEATLVIHEQAVVFLKRHSSEAHSVAVMAQGHYPLGSRAAGVVLRPSPRLAELENADATSAVHQLVDQSVARAQTLVRAAWKRR